MDPGLNVYIGILYSVKVCQKCYFFTVKGERCGKKKSGGFTCLFYLKKSFECVEN